MDLNTLVQIIKTIISLIIVILLANIILKSLNKYTKNNNRRIIIIEKISVGNNSSIGIIKVLNEYFLMSFTNTKNEILKKLDEEEVLEYIKKREDSQMIKDKLNLKVGGKGE